MVREIRNHDWLTPHIDVRKKYFDDVTGDNWIRFIQIIQQKENNKWGYEIGVN